MFACYGDCGLPSFWICFYQFIMITLSLFVLNLYAYFIELIFVSSIFAYFYVYVIFASLNDDFCFEPNCYLYVLHLHHLF